MSKKVLFLMLIVLSISLFANSCSKATSKKQTEQNNSVTSKNKAIEPEEIISKKEAGDLLGTAVNDPKKSMQSSVGVKLNMYNAANGEHSKFLQVGITEEAFFDKKTLAAGQNPKTIFEGIKSGFSNQLKKVNDIGDDAFFSPLGIHILSGNYYISIAVQNPKDPSSSDILEKAGKLAVENLIKKLN